MSIREIIETILAAWTMSSAWTAVVQYNGCSPLMSFQCAGPELSSAPELFTDAAMRNALRKIAALQAKPQPRSRASSAHTSAFVSSRVSSEGEAAVSAASRDGSPGGHDAVQKNFTQVLASFSLACAFCLAPKLRQMTGPCMVS